MMRLSNLCVSEIFLNETIEGGDGRLIDKEINVNLRHKEDDEILISINADRFSS